MQEEVRRIEKRIEKSSIDMKEKEERRIQKNIEIIKGIGKEKIQTKHSNIIKLMFQNLELEKKEESLVSDIEKITQKRYAN